MTATDELREAITWFVDSQRDRFSAIADRIDEQCERELTMARGEAVQHLGSEVAKKYVKLPVDADGEPIHLQDRMSWDNGTFVVHELNLTADGWTTWDELHGYTVRADQCRHYHEQTVEDVLREMLSKYDELRLGPSAFDPFELMAEYAAKLRLAGDDV